MSPAALMLAVLKLTLINLVLSGDNAVVIALAARSLPRHLQRKAMLLGGGAAILLRVVMTALVAVALKVPLLQLTGGLMLVWIAMRLVRGEDESAHVRSGHSLGDAVWTMILADVVMSLDNVLAVGGAARGDFRLLLVGLGISMAVILFASGLIATLMNRYNWVVYLGAAILGWTAGEMILHDRWLVSQLRPGPATELLVPAVMAVLVLLAGFRRQQTQTPRPL